MKKLINRPETVVEEMVEGLIALYPGLLQLPGHTVVVRADALEVRDRQVALISGGGSGHEPAHAGYVGRGMLSAAVAGDVFTSPSPDAILAAIRAVTGPPGALLIVKNYTGDRLNFGLAAELARASGLAVEMVMVDDDVALAQMTEAGRRGIAGTVFVHKVAGAASEAGANLSEVAAEARAAVQVVSTMGVGLSAATVPAAGKPSFTLGEQEIELGLGIHGEPGVRRGPLEPADFLVNHLLEPILANADLHPSDRVALLVNNLGGTTTMELAIVARHALAVLEASELIVERTYAGTFLSALEMAGVSLSILQLDDTRLARLDAPTDAPAWPNAAARQRTGARYLPTEPEVAQSAAQSSKLPQTQLGQTLQEAILAATESLIDAAPRLTEMDRVVGDGDLGISLARGSQAVRQALPNYPLDDPAATLHALSLTLQKSLGGSSGPLYAVFFLRASGRLQSSAIGEPKTWAEAFRAGCQGMSELGGAKPGDRTMLDALVPAADAFQSAVDAGQTLEDAFATAVQAAETGAGATANMAPRRGRSSYIGDRALGYPDPGAEAITIWLRALLPFLPVIQITNGST